MSKKKGPTQKDKTNFSNILFKNVNATPFGFLTNTKTLLLKLRESTTLCFCYFFINKVLIFRKILCHI